MTILRKLSPLTWLMVVSGTLLIGSLLAMSIGIMRQDALWQIIGMMGIVAGVIKIAAILIWTRVAGLGRDDYTPTPAP